MWSKKHNEKVQCVQKSEWSKFPTLVGGVQTRPWTLCPRHHWWTGVPLLGESSYPLCPDITFTSPGITKPLKNSATTQGHWARLSPSQDTAWPCRSIAPPLTLIFQQIYNTGNTTPDWRDAIVSPIYKKDCKRDHQNYRPLLITSINCKIHEHIICSTMMSHLDTCGILTNDQHGFRKGLSKETPLLTAVHDWSHTLHKGPQTDTLFFDFLKTFDSAPHSRLLEKLRYYGEASNTNKVIEGLCGAELRKNATLKLFWI